MAMILLNDVAIVMMTMMTAVFSLNRCSLLFWFMGNILIGFVVSRGALFLTSSGITLVMSCVIYATLQPSTPLVIPLGGHFLELSFSWCFYMSIVSGKIDIGTHSISHGTRGNVSKERTKPLTRQ